MFNRSDFGHTKCDLLTGHEDDDIINYSIEGGIFINLRRWCSRQRILYPEHPRAQKHYRSDAANKNEQARQLARYPFTIHPYSKFNLVWDAKKKYEELMQQIKQYMTYKGLPVNIKEKIWLYFKFKYQNRFFNDAEINSVLSNAIKEEVMMNIAEKNLAQTAFLKFLPRLILCKVVANLISEIYLPDDVIIVAGDHADGMYFIYYGTVAVYNEHNEEVCHLKDGDYFGDVDMYFDSKRTHSVVAITPCEVFMLKKSTVLLILDDYPKLSKKFKNFSRENLTKYSASKYPYIEL
ncbi:unnamed protein product [Psylliodes chrysocephalus]|uniref:Cyclic nucleotide-binding domain-containing protein n=1 Tax=Psylliodes chrysocephalus TaxID=3402493 RepID=A0A9P0CSP2_9CUCU|nr:unnamed protein product [Psylliodes chrysocephala]